jgi:LmbE family N-acetylglucosaminyl deacetylase
VLSLPLGSDPDSPIDVLCIGAHADDIEIGCGATLLQLVKARPVTCHWVVLSGDDERLEEAAVSANAFLEGCARVDWRVASFRESYFPYLGSDVKDYVQALAADISPDVVFSHHGDDLHQDHRIVGELCRNAFRDHLILEYEVPKYDGRHGAPNVFVPVEQWALARKLELVMSRFPSQSNRYWYTEDTFTALMRLRGVEARSPTGYAEAFFGQKVTIAPA